MKTKPSGKPDFCMKGAPLVSGTINGGSPTSDAVGAFVGWSSMDDEVAVASFEIDDTDEAVEDAEVPEVVVVELVSPTTLVMDEMLGKSLTCPFE